MGDSSSNADFDAKSPAPVREYSAMVPAVNVGYDLVFLLTSCFLRARSQSKLELLVVGAGGGHEIQQFLPGNLGWRLLGVDPSQEMLALARREAERVGAIERVELIQGTAADLPAARQFDAATCLFVLHFLADDAKVALLNAIRERLRPDAPLLVASAARLSSDELREDFLGAWQQHGQLMGLPGERMSEIIQQLVGQQEGATDADDYARLLRDAGFPRVAPFLSVMNGAIVAWIAR